MSMFALLNLENRNGTTPKRQVGAGARLALGAACLGFAISLSAQVYPAKLDIHSFESMPDGRHPELVYWFFTPETLENKQYLRDVDHLASDTPFTLAFLTHRNGINFADSARIHPALAEIVSAAHRRGLKIGLQFDPATAMDGRGMTVPDEQSLVSEAETILDAAGAGTVSLAAVARGTRPTESRLLKAVAFRKLGDGFYDPATLVDLTASATASSSAPGHLSVTIDAGPANAGKTVYILAEHYFYSLDMYGEPYIQLVHDLIDRYKDIPLDGTAFDEFSYMHIPPPWTQTAPFRDRIAGDAFGHAFAKSSGKSLVEVLFAMRYAPQGRPDIRIKAIDEYWDFLRKGPLRVEQEFHDYSKKNFGPQTFIGIHDTYHNSLTNDEVWSTGLNWWVNPREYGQSDEDLSLPIRMGLLVSHPEPVMYDQYYGFDIPKFAAKAMRDARFDARLHYHGYNDVQKYGVNLSSDAFLKVINPVERKIRLLNLFDPAAPELPVLVIFGMPALLNWYPETAHRNAYDIDGSLDIEAKASAVWAAGYRCALLPSDLIDSGQLRLDAQNRPTINGHRFRAVIYLYPQYARPETLAFLERYTAAGGKLMLEGAATADFNGTDIRDRFRAIATHAVVKGFDAGRIPELGVQSNAIEGGAQMEDGSILLTDLPSLENHQSKPFQWKIGTHEFTGSYVGVFGFKVDAGGELEKLACGECSSVSRDGKPIFSLAHPADVVLIKTSANSFQVSIQGKEGDNKVSVSGDANGIR